MRRFFSRFLLLLLFGVVVYAVVRLIGGPHEPDAVFSFGTSLETREDRHAAFEVERPVRLAVHAVGSIETDSTMAATAWIVRRSDGKLIWQMDPAEHAPIRGTLAAADDTLAFETGVYDAYFAAYGDPDLPRDPGDRSFLERLFGGDGRLWRGDQDRWRFRVRYASDADLGSARELHDDKRDPAVTLAQAPGLIWTSGPIRDREAAEHLFEVTAPARVRVRTTGEVVGGAVRDGGSILPMTGQDTIWAMTPQAAWAGGSPRNRQVDTTLTLQPGLYRARYTSGDDHAYQAWLGNPPYVPESWGLTLTAADSASAGRVLALDPWQRLPRIASFTCVAADALREDTFTLPDTTDVLLVAMGEVVGSTAYDYAILLREEAGTRTEVWTMGRDNTEPAGGADKNRRAEVALQLTPGTYTLSYRTDGSHDCSDFNADAPPDPEHWGATLFALDLGFDPGRIEHTISERSTDEDAEADAEVQLVRLTRIGNDADARARFSLDEGANVRIYAVGEILPSGRYDYAWILPEAGTDTTWVMHRENTEWAGGSKKNRVFDGTLYLPSGTYTVHYRTNGTHAYESWDQPAPNDPEAWGVTLWRRGD